MLHAFIVKLPASFWTCALTT